MGFKQAAALIFLRNNNKFLFLKRIKPPYIGMWVPVGGKIEAHESPEQAAKREVNEETGIEVHTLNYLGIVTETSPSNFNWISYIYLSNIENIIPPKCNEGELGWKEEDELDNTTCPTIDLIVLKYIRLRQKFNFEAQYDIDGKLILLKERLEDIIFEF